MHNMLALGNDYPDRPLHLVRGQTSFFGTHAVGYAQSEQGFAKKSRPVENSSYDVSPVSASERAVGSKELPAGTNLLRGQYRLEGVLQEGGFGITYRAQDSLQRQVVIKECFPEALCVRVQNAVRPRSAAYEEKFETVVGNFLKEARRLARLEHSNIVNVHQVFEENGTAYMAMDYVEGVDLLTLLEDCPERLAPDTLEKVLTDTLHALRYVHELGILHRDISPDNIMLDHHGRVTLIDFGAARDNFLRQDRALTSLLAVKDGYSPHEFYLTEADQQASSDLYSLAATFYHLVSGEAPPDSQNRVALIASGKLDPYVRLTDQELPFNPAFLQAIDTCLAISQKDRLQSAQAWLDVLDGSTLQASTECVPEVELAESLVGSIAALVEATNKDVEEAAKTPGPKEQTKNQSSKRLVLHPARKNTPAKQLVDIFGNPIDDVDAWMREQEALLAAREADHENESDIDTDLSTERNEHAARSSAVSMLLSWFFRPHRIHTS